VAQEIESPPQMFTFAFAQSEVLSSFNYAEF
jgi:hypothetical protein